jgi:DNA-binding protein H-NS
MAKIDISKLSLAERRELLAELKTASNPLKDPDYVKRCIEMRTKLERQCLKEGLQLAHVFTASDKERKSYTHPETGNTWDGWGKPPAWVTEQKKAQKVAA